MVLLSKDTIPPGEEGEIKATFDAGNLRDRIIRKVRLETNDPEQSTVIIIFSAHVQVAFGAEKNLISFGRITKPEQDVTKKVKLIGKYLPDLTVTQVQSTNPWIKADKIISEDKSVEPEIEVTLKKNTPLGPQQSTIKVLTNNPEHVAQFSVTATVQGHTIIKPERIIFRVSPDSNDLSQKVKITNDTIDAFKIETVEIAENPFPELLDKNKEGKNYLKPSKDDLDIKIEAFDKNTAILSITLKRKLDQGQRLKGEIVISTNYKPEELITAQYYAFYSESKSSRKR